MCLKGSINSIMQFPKILLSFQFSQYFTFYIFQMKHPVMLKKYVVLKKFLSVIKANQEHAVTLFCAKPNISTVIDHGKSPQGSQPSTLACEISANTKSSLKNQLMCVCVHTSRNYFGALKLVQFKTFLDGMLHDISIENIYALK